MSICQITHCLTPFIRISRDTSYYNLWTMECLNKIQSEKWIIFKSWRDRFKIKFWEQPVSGLTILSLKQPRMKGCIMMDCPHRP